MLALFITLTMLFFSTTCYLFYPWLQKRFAFRKYIDEYRSVESKLEHVHTTKEGYKVYTFKNLLDMPPKRAIRADVAGRMARLCMTEKMFDEYTRDMSIAVNKNDLKKVGYLIGRMEERRLLAGEENSLKAFADALFLIEGENPKATSAYWYKIKQKIWENDEDDYAFFLHRSMMFIRDISDQSAIDFLHSLQLQAVEKSLNKL